MAKFRVLLHRYIKLWFCLGNFIKKVINSRKKLYVFYKKSHTRVNIYLLFSKEGTNTPESKIVLSNSVLSFLTI